MELETLNVQVKIQRVINLYTEVERPVFQGPSCTSTASLRYLRKMSQNLHILDLARDAVGIRVY